MSGKHGAVVIGVDRPGELRPLESAADGATRVAKWLRGEGYDTCLLTDAKGGSVTAAQIKEAVKRFVDAKVYRKFVLYFSGHGLWKGETEIWLLNGAPNDVDEAVNWTETFERAKDSGIPNVVLISDACRSLPQSRKAMNVRGSVVFPNLGSAQRSKVDRFLAAVPATSAYESKLGPDQRVASIFTECLLQAFREPSASMVASVTEDGERFEVVPNRRLEGHLPEAVGSLLASVSVRFEQTPEIDVVSDEEFYLARVRRTPAGEATPAPEAPSGPPLFNVAPPDLESLAKRGVSVRDPLVQDLALRSVAAQAVEDALGWAPAISERRRDTIGFWSNAVHFSPPVSTREAEQLVPHFETETGFTCTGARISEAACTQGALAEILPPRAGESIAVMRITLQGSDAASVMLRFESGTGTALAALRGFVGHVTVHAGEVIDVRYVPSDNSQLWAAFEGLRMEIDALHYAVSAAVHRRVFRARSQGEARALADRIRLHKGLDPTLGLYAGYAYADADQDDELREVREILRQERGADLFDLALLSRDPGTSVDPSRLVPFCPMLTQGWNFLRVRGWQLPAVLAEGQDDLMPALWTTFRAERADRILAAVRSGEIR